MADLTKTPKPRLYKMVSLPKSSGGGATIKVNGKTITGNQNSQIAMNSIIKSMNSLGATVNSLAIITESIANQSKKQILTEIKQQRDLIKRQENLRKLKGKTDKDREDKRRKESQRQRDSESEKKSEGAGKFLTKFSKFVTAAAGGFFSGLAQILGSIFKFFIVTSVLDWITKPGNTGKVVTLLKGIVGIFKVFQRLLSFGITNALDGIAKLIENPISFKGLFGAVQFIVGAAVLFTGMRWLKNPASMAKDFVNIVVLVAKGIKNLKKGVGVWAVARKFASTKAGKFAKYAAIGVGAGAASGLMGGTKEEMAGTAVGAGAGSFAGEMIGQKLGGDAGAGVGAAAGGMIGGLLGGSVGKALKPLTDAIGKFFKLIGDILKPVLDFIGNIGKEFFSAIGDLIQNVVNFIEPHKDTLGFLAKISFGVAFAPLIAFLKGITWLIRLFVPKKSDSSTEGSGKPSKSVGGKIVVPKMASGGTIGSTQMVNPISQRLQQGLSDAIMLPFRAVGIGLISAMGMVGSVFGAFLPGPIQALLGSAMAPIASMFGVPNSIFKKVTSIALKGFGGVVKGVVNTGGDILEKLMGGNSEDSVTGLLHKIRDSLLKMHDKQTPAKSIGGVISGTKRAAGGWIDGPMSGYPVSLDGGRSTSFIGHGKEWVGFKGHATGGGSGSAFVVPFNTPATVRTPSLTNMRMNQARAGGYSLPGFATGGYSLPGFATGGKFDPAVFNKTMSGGDTVSVGKDNHRLRFRYDIKDGNVRIGHVIEETNNAAWDFLNAFGNDNDLKTLSPSKDAAWNQLITSANLRDSLKNNPILKKQFGSIGRGPGAPADMSKVKIITHPDAQKFSDWTVQGKRKYYEKFNQLKAQGKSDSEAQKVASQDAWKESAEKNNVKTSEPTSPESPGAATSTDPMQALDEALKKWQEAFGGNKTGDALDSQSSATKSAQEKAQQEKVKAAGAQLASNAAQVAGNSSKPPAPSSPPAIPLNSSGSSGRPSSDINPFLKSQFGLISQSNYAPTLVG